MRIIVIIPVVAIPRRKVIIQVPRELVFIDDAIDAGIAVSVGIHVLVGIRVLVGIGILVSIGILLHRRGSRRSIHGSGSTIDHRGRRYINTGSAEPKMGMYIYLCIAFPGDQHAACGQDGQCKELFHLFVILS